MKQGRDYGVRRGEGSIAERVTKDGVVRYLARYHDGDRVRSRTFATLDEAEDHLRGIGRAKRSGRYVPTAEWTVAEVVSDYLERGRDRWKPNTYATYQTILHQVIVPSIGKDRVTELTARRCQHWIDGLTRTYSPARIEIIRAVLTGALKEAVRMDVLPANPLAGVRMPRKRRADRQTWHAADVAAIMRASKPEPMMHAYYAVALTTGMRPGEIRALMWDDIDLDAGRVIVRRSMTRDEHYRPVVGDTTKTGRVRVVAVPDRAVLALRRYRAEQTERRLRTEHWADTGLVFDRGDGHVMAQQTFARHHRAMCDRAGVPYTSPHGMRHAAATLLLEAGVDVKVVADTLGHSTTTTTRDIYQHTSERLQRTAADTLGALLDDALEA